VAYRIRAGSGKWMEIDRRKRRKKWERRAGSTSICQREKGTCFVEGLEEARNRRKNGDKVGRRRGETCVEVT